MKRGTVCAVLALACSVSVIPIVTGSSAGEVLERLGIAEQSARDYVWNSLSYGSFYYPNLPALKKVPAEERAALVGLVGQLARSYAESADFAARYAQYRESKRPQAPEAPLSMDQQRLQYKESLGDNLREMEESMKTMPADMRAMMEESLAVLRQQIELADDPENPQFGSQMDEVQQQVHQAELEEHRQKLAAWERDYPEDPRQLIRMRLEQFLKESDGVDFTAELKPGPDGKMLFADPAYESKPRNWKLSYRAGPETVEAARTFARTWLDDLTR